MRSVEQSFRNLRTFCIFRAGGVIARRGHAYEIVPDKKLCESQLRPFWAKQMWNVNAIGVPRVGKGDYDTLNVSHILSFCALRSPQTTYYCSLKVKRVGHPIFCLMHEQAWCLWHVRESMRGEAGSRCITHFQPQLLTVNLLSYCYLTVQ